MNGWMDGCLIYTKYLTLKFMLSNFFIKIYDKFSSLYQPITTEIEIFAVK